MMTTIRRKTRRQISAEFAWLSDKSIRSRQCAIVILQYNFSFSTFAKLKAVGSRDDFVTRSASTSIGIDMYNAHIGISSDIFSAALAGCLLTDYRNWIREGDIDLHL